MSKAYRSARGKMIDMDKIKLAQENKIAVGNMKVNARGDKIGMSGEVVQGRNQIMDQAYAVDTFAPYSPNDPKTFQQQQTVVENNKAKELHDMMHNLTTVTSPETAATTSATPPARGSLASSVAKPVNVVQKPAPTPQQQKKSNGPTRI
jgi:hypothetical protein